MNEAVMGDTAFIGYEYKDVTVKNDMASVYADGYTNFGWTLEGAAHPIQKVGAVTLKRKRDRKIRNKAELTRLQRQFDARVNELRQPVPNETTLAAMQEVQDMIARLEDEIAELEAMLCGRSRERRWVSCRGIGEQALRCKSF